MARVTPATARVAIELNRQLFEWIFHPLALRAFARRTPTSPPARRPAASVIGAKACFYS
jgi:hypothetical protein